MMPGRQFVDKVSKCTAINKSKNDASKHINSIWEQPNDWWGSQEVVAAREHFFDMCGRVNKEWLKEWSVFFKKHLEVIKQMNHTDN